MQTFDQILNGDVPAPQATPEPQADVTEQPAPPEPEGDTPPVEAIEPETVKGEEEATPSDAAPPAANVEEPLDKRISAFQSKAEDEKRKRQDREKELEDARKALAERDAYIEQVKQWQAQQQAQPHEQPEIDLLDPQQAQSFISNQIAPIGDQIYETRVLLSQEMFRTAHADYDEMETVFAEQMKQDPSLAAKLRAHPLPAKFAYEEGKKLKMLQELSDPEAYKAKLREEILAELQKQQADAASQQPAPVPTITKPVPQPPQSLAGVPSAARDPIKQPYGGPTPLSQLLD